MSQERASAAVTEIPVVFDCEGSRLLGVVHLPDQPRPRGLLGVVAGGPQYRGGLARIQVRMARQLAEAGVPVMRFDYRGLGDSEGQFKGFRHVEADIGAALQTFLAQVPGMREVALWGGCDASSASLINGWKFPQVTGLLLGNPWVHSEETGDQVAVAHYRQRLRDKDFWLKLLRGGYNPLPAVATVARNLWARTRRALRGPGDTSASARMQDDPSLPFQQRMCLGLSRFKGDVLMLMSGRSLVSKEFDQLVVQSPAWQQALAAPAQVVRVDLPNADQAYSNIASQREVIDLVTRWMCAPESVQGHRGAAAVLAAARHRLNTATGQEA
ncbi:MAG: hydrolase 1, exosortase A system-associated [Burkholderiaceae bacterium]|nr:hydrolase 1, exosortase A system-associated [Rhodoferax sp.]MCP5271933.1 hydrolase 1, exosortase A system-associated [Burkholderiaceae bacterium]